jgi:hypothetical protein
VRSDMRSSYFKLADKRAFPHFADTDLIYNGDLYIYAAYAEQAKPRLNLIPPHPFGPPERCYYTQVTDWPGFVEHGYGQGKAIYLPWLPGALFHRQGYPNTTDFIADLLTQVAGLAPVGDNLPPMVEVTHFASRGGEFQLLHLVNGSGHFGNSFFAPVPMADLVVVITSAREPHSVKSLVHGQPYNYTWQAGQLTILIPKMELFDAVQIG